MTAHPYIVLGDHNGKHLAEFIEASALADAVTITADTFDMGGADYTQWSFSLIRPMSLLSDGEHILWRTALWIADQGGALPSHTEARMFLDADNYDLWTWVVGARLAGGVW